MSKKYPKKIKSKTRWGTSHFKDLDSALKYYAQQGENANAVSRKINESLITIGAPQIKSNQNLGLDLDGRYWIEG